MAFDLLLHPRTWLVLGLLGLPACRLDVPGGPGTPDGAPVDDDASMATDGPPGPDPDAARADAGTPPPPRCGSPQVLTDDFTDGVQSPAWEWSYEANGTTYAETGGRLVVTVATAGASWSEAGYVTGRAYDLRDGRMSVEVPQMVNVATDAYAFFSAAIDGGNQIDFAQQHGVLAFAVRVAGVLTPVATTPYDPVAHRFWQLRETAGTTFWETSPDGVTWTVRASAATPLFVGAIRPSLGAGIDPPTPGVGAVAFDQFNGGGAPTAAWCKAATFSDDFGDGVEGPFWSRSYDNADCVASESGGRLRLAPGSNVVEYCGRASGAAYDLTDSQVVVKVPGMLNTATSAEANLTLAASGGNRLAITQEAGDLLLQKYLGGSVTDIATVPYDPVAHLWWRLRAAADVVYWETSPDGVTFTVRATAPAPFPLTALEIMLEAGTWEPVGTPGQLQFDQLN